MKLQGLIDLSLILILPFSSKGQTWTITVPGSINATQGSSVTIQCTFTYPTQYSTDNVQLYWKKKERSHFAINDNDKNAFFYHPNDTFVLERYRLKTELIGNKDKGNCSIMISDITDNINDIYLRIIVHYKDKDKDEKYSFKKFPVSIFVKDQDSLPVVNTGFTDPPFTTPEVTSDVLTAQPVASGISSIIYVATIVPVSALLIIIIVTGILCYRKHKRSQTFTREESGYYANFSRASSNPARSETTCKKNDDMKYPEPKAIDEPVYVNTEAITGQMDQSVDHKETIYGNVDYSQ